MTTILRIILAALLVALVWPEFHRYSAEHDLYRLTGQLQGAIAHGANTPEGTAAIRRVSTESAQLDTYPGDWRALQLAGSASLMSRDPDRALAIFSAALARGERPEIDYNIGLAHRLMLNKPQSHWALARAAWVSPAIAEQINEQKVGPYKTQNTERERKLAAGTLTLADLPPAPRAAQGGEW